jgi:hypothetical protein
MKRLIVVLLIILSTHAFCQMRTAEILTADTSGWEMVKQAVKTAKNKAELLPADPLKAKEAIYQTQVTTRSAMGAIVFYTGGVLIDNGWIRLLGSGSTKLTRSLPEWNKGKTFKEYGQKPAYLLIGNDALGGFFAVNGGALGNDMGKVYYLAPETLQWQSLAMGYTDFVDFCLNGDLDKFYRQYRWKGWEKDSNILSGDKVFNFYPPLWSKEGQDIEKVSRKIVPVQEQYDFNLSTIKSFQH